MIQMIWTLKWKMLISQILEKRMYHKKMKKKKVNVAVVIDHLALVAQLRNRLHRTQEKRWDLWNG